MPLLGPEGERKGDLPGGGAPVNGFFPGLPPAYLVAGEGGHPWSTAGGVVVGRAKPTVELRMATGL